MKILDYEYMSETWNIQKVEFQDINLIVGESASGKTRLLNTIFNIGSYVAQGELAGVSEWRISVGIDEDKYYWKVATTTEDDKPIVKSEELYKNNKLILSRNQEEMSLEEKILPKLEKNRLSLSILREEELIRPLFDGFSTILRRRFFADELQRGSGNYVVSRLLMKRIGATRDLFELYKADLPLNPRLYLLKTNFPKIYEAIISLYKESFEFIEAIDLKPSDEISNHDIQGNTPVFCIKEHNIDKWIQLEQLSSGMQKALLIITDLYTLPKGSIYFIDEYENSLGVSPINILPDALLAEDFDLQLFLTSHHPYIISKFPVENWYVAHRKGTNVKFLYGTDLEKRYGLSKQDKYYQLLNDPYYSEGVE